LHDTGAKDRCFVNDRLVEPVQVELGRVLPEARILVDAAWVDHERGASGELPVVQSVVLVGCAGPVFESEQFVVAPPLATDDQSSKPVSEPLARRGSNVVYDPHVTRRNLEKMAGQGESL
jgi:hypothetical protein